jgi:hypothetical protein
MVSVLIIENYSIVTRRKIKMNYILNISVDEVTLFDEEDVGFDGVWLYTLIRSDNSFVSSESGLHGDELFEGIVRAAEAIESDQKQMMLPGFGSSDISITVSLFGRNKEFTLSNMKDEAERKVLSID